MAAQSGFPVDFVRVTDETVGTEAQSPMLEGVVLCT